MKIGLVGYQGVGKSTLFEWLTGVAADASMSHTAQSAMATVPDQRMQLLGDVYNPKKMTYASLEIVDTPGLMQTHEGNAARLALIREAGCLILVTAAFDGSDPMTDLRTFEEDLMLADMGIVSSRIEKIQMALKKPVPKSEREDLLHEEHTLKIVLDALESGEPLRSSEMTEDQLRVTRSFRLLSEKPRLVIVNSADDEEQPERFEKNAPEGVDVVVVSASLELELARMSTEDREEFERDMGIGNADRDNIIRKIMSTAGYMVFFTSGEKEVRSWLLPIGSKAVEAAAEIHTDLARGFIRAEVMTVSDLVRLGSEREVKANHLVRQEPKDYVVKDDDILLIRFSV